MRWILMAGAVAAFGAWSATVYFVGAEAGRDDAEAAQVPGLVATLAEADKKAGELQTTLGRLGRIGSAVTANIAKVNTAADEANKRLADAGVMASCPRFSERDVRLLNAEIDRLEAAAGVAGS